MCVHRRIIPEQDVVNAEAKLPHFCDYKLQCNGAATIHPRPRRAQFDDQLVHDGSTLDADPSTRTPICVPVHGSDVPVSASDVSVKTFDLAQGVHGSRPDHETPTLFYQRSSSLSTILMERPKNCPDSPTLRATSLH